MNPRISLEALSADAAAQPWQQLLHGLPAAAGVFGPAGDALFLNEEAAALLGGSPRLLGPDGRSPLAADRLPWARACRGERVAGEEVWVSGGGEPRCALVSARAVSFAGREAALVTFLDITRRRAAERELWVSERRLAQVFLSNPNPIAIALLPEGRIINLNDRMMQLLGYQRDEILGRTTAELGIWADARERESIQQLLAAGRSIRNVEIKLRRKNGQLRTAQASFELIEAAPSGERVVVVMLNDVTERGEMRRSLADYSKRFQLLIEAVKDYAIFLLDEKGRVATWNVGGQRMLRYRDDEIVGKPTSAFYSADETRRGKPKRLLERAFREGRAEEVGWRWRKDGTRFWADVLVTALRDESGKLTGYAKIIRDLTERRKAEEAEDLKRREEIQREIVATVSHELRTPIAAIRGFTETLLNGGLDDAKHRRDFVETVDKHASRLSRLVEDILNLSALDAGTEGSPVKIELLPFVEQAVAGLRPLVRRKSLKVSLKVEAGLAVRADADRLGQVVSNLLSNAIKYNRAKGRIDVRATRSGKRVQVSVSDTGVGIPKAQLPLIFERFHRTAEARKHASGSGLGLSIVKKIVESWRGRVWAESSARGAVFHFTVPAA